MMAFEEVKPAFGAVRDTLESYRLNGIINYGESFQHLSNTCNSLVEQARRPCGIPCSRGWPAMGGGRHSICLHSVQMPAADDARCSCSFWRRRVLG